MSPGPQSPRHEDRLVLAGELTIYTAAEHLGRIRTHLEAHHDCDLDLSGVSEMDSAGLQILLWAQRAAGARNASLRLVAHSHAVAEVLDLLNLRAAFGLGSAESVVEDRA